MTLLSGAERTQASIGVLQRSDSSYLRGAEPITLFLRKYRHLYDGEKRKQAMRLEALVRAHLDASRTDDVDESASPLNGADEDHWRTWDRTRDLPRGARAALSYSRRWKSESPERVRRPST